MITTFWVLSALLAILAIGFVLWPLIRGEDAEFSRQAKELRQQITTLDRAHADGHVDDKRFGARRKELQAQLGALAETVVPARGGKATVVFLALAIPAGAIFVYQHIGTPQALELLPRLAAQGVTSQPGPNAAPAAAADPSTPAPGLTDAITNLEKRLAENPDDTEGWFLLGQSYMTTNRFVEARDAFKRAYELNPSEPAIMELYGHAIAFAAGDNPIPDEARALFEQALSINPGSQRSLYFLGVAAMQREDPAAALLYWEQLNGMLEPGSPVAQRLTEDLATARAMVGDAPAVASLFPDMASAAAPEATPQAAPAGTAPAADPDNDAASPASTSAEGLVVEVTLDASLRERVAPNDVVFIYARAAEGPRMPLAIQRIAAGQLPIQITLDDSMAMSPAMSLSTFPQVIVGARISKSGNATPQPGDMEAVSSPLPNDFGETIRLNIDQVL